MLLRLITVIALIQFMLLMISGMTIQDALYRSMLVFMILFMVVYLSIFFMNVIRGEEQSSSTTAMESSNSKIKDE